MKPINKLTERRLARFWLKVDKSGECWEWTGGYTRDGYGQFRVWRSTCRAHRVSYTIAYDDPGKLQVCHACDNPKCVNPAHLWIGTQQENVLDRHQKGRKASDIHVKSSVLSAAQVRDIIASGESVQDLADRYGINQASISYIKTGGSWKHLEWIQDRNETHSRKYRAIDVKGVYLSGHRYMADIKGQYLGTFDTIEEAAEAIRKKSCYDT